MILDHDSGIVNIGISNHHVNMDPTLGALIAARLHPNTNLTAKEFAKRIRRSPSYVSQLVNNQKAETPPPDVLAAIERELGLSQVIQLRAWGYVIPDGLSPAYVDPALARVAARWDSLPPPAITAITSVIQTVDLALPIAQHPPDSPPPNGQRPAEESSQSGE